jgi:hypothetical protein
MTQSEITAVNTATALAKRMINDTRRAANICDVDDQALIATGIINALQEAKLLDYVQECIGKCAKELGK